MTPFTPHQEAYLRRFPNERPDPLPPHWREYRVAGGVIASQCQLGHDTLGCWAFYPDRKPVQ